MTHSPHSKNSFHPGLVWLDTSGKPINAHGGGVLFHEGVYYWYGEHKLPGRSEAELADGGVHLYSSGNLYEWKDEGLVLDVSRQPEGSPLEPGCLLERPKVVFNALTKKFVMFFKFYPKGMGYEVAYLGVAVSESPTGVFRFDHPFLAADSEKGSGDFAVVKDRSGALNHLAVRKPDKAFCAGKLRSDYLSPEGRYQEIKSIPAHTEAPAFFFRNEKWYFLGSGSTGWKPNAARSFVGDVLTGPFQELGNPCRGKNPHNGLGSELTFGGQISFVLPVEEKPGNFIAMFDLWNPDLAENGRYVWLPIRFENERPVVEWKDSWEWERFF